MGELAAFLQIVVFTLWFQSEIFLDISRTKISISYTFIILYVLVCLLNKTRHACKTVYFSSDALS